MVKLRSYNSAMPLDEGMMGVQIPPGLPEIALLAQVVEQSICNAQVEGSSPSESTKLRFFVERHESM